MTRTSMRSSSRPPAYSQAYSNPRIHRILAWQAGRATLGAVPSSPGLQLQILLDIATS